MKQSGGHVVVSTEVGQGTAFEVYLPRVESGEPAPARPAEDMAYARGHETVLLVEDEDVVRRLARRSLESCGYRVFEAANGADALALYEQAEPPTDLLITDVVMPRMSGSELVEKLRLARPHLRVLYMSGYTDDAVVHRGLVDEETNFIQKPFTMRALAKKVRDVLDGPV